MDCLCESVTRFDGAEAQAYAGGHLALIGSSDETWIEDYVCSATGVRWRKWYPFSELHGGGPPRLERFDLTDPAAALKRIVMSRIIHDEDRRPIYVYRTAPQMPDDSGWTATAGETHELAGSEVVAAHMTHLVDRWPELARVFADPRADSHWEWDDATRQYEEIQPPR